MMLRRKLVLFIGMAILVLLVVQYFFSNFILLTSIETIEREDTYKNVGRVLNAFSQEEARLNISVSDWARWNDTYEFVQGNLSEYPTQNLMDETFENFQINVMLFINRSGQFVYGEAFDLIKGEEMPVPQSLEQHIGAGSLLLNHPTIRSTINGILVLPDRLMFISSWPVLTNEGEGPIQGSLIMGRYLDDVVIKRIETITQLKVTVRLLNDPKLSEDYQKAIASLSEGAPIFVQPLNTTDVAGYALLNDIYGAPSLIIRVDIPRAIYAQGIAIMNSFFIVFLATCLTSVGITLLLVEKVLLYRLNKLRMNVKTIGFHKDIIARVEEPTGNDEVSELTHAINGMLEQLQKSQEELNRLARSLHETNENLKTKIDELEMYKKITIGRELKMVEMKKEIDELCNKLGEKSRYTG